MTPDILYKFGFSLPYAENHWNKMSGWQNLQRKPKQPKRIIFAALWGYIKLEMLKVKTKMNHFAMKTKIYNQALKAAFKELTNLKLAACA